ncbi:MAG: transcription antitermination factor NusB [Phycisphaeraceae bacterium]|nr:transcription antitermination factor NusB [Phycisphaeraceae bacterium]
MAEQTLIRRMAFLALFQLDARGELTDSELESSVLHGDDPKVDGTKVPAASQEMAWTLAREAFADRKRCDDVMKNLAPEWPAYRQAAVDRALLRLAHFEIHSGRVPAPIAIDSAVELAKEFSTEKSPGFINALLDQAAKRQVAKKESKKGAGKPEEESETEGGAIEGSGQESGAGD